MESISLSMNALVLVNSSSPSYRWGAAYVLSYLDHFGIPYTLWDIHQSPLPPNLSDYPLIVIAHPAVDPRGYQLPRTRLLEAVQAGTGLVTFDPAILLTQKAEPLSPAQAGSGASSLLEKTAEPPPGVSFPSAELTFLEGHPITARHSPGETIRLIAPLRLEPITSDEVLLATAGDPLLEVSTLGAGRIVQWASLDWMDTHYLGPLGGLDDVLWRSFVWAARKPFALRGLPPLVTMRVDDVAGTGHLWGQSPLGWAHVANRYGFKPWLGLFPFNLTEPAIQELRALLLAGKATAFPHAFGRPVREINSSSETLTPAEAIGQGNPCPYYDYSGFPLRATSYDEFIYYDHEHGHPWTDEEAAQGLAAIDAWYASHAPLPMSSYAICHWGEMGINTVAHVRDRWGCEFIATYHGVDAPLDGARWLIAGPFRKHETPGSALFDRAERGDRSVYYANFINFADRQFFLCCTEVRDETGYEWAPDGDVEKSAGRGIRILKRALDSFCLPVLFTHETDYIYKISPPAWEAQLEQITRGIAPYQPIYVTLDEALRYVRATKTSQLSSAAYDPVRRQVTARFTGRAEVLTYYHLFTHEEEIVSRLVEVQPFEDGSTVRCGIK